MSPRREKQRVVGPVKDNSNSPGLSQTSDVSKYSPSAQGSRSQASQTAFEGLLPSPTCNGLGILQHTLGNGTNEDWPRASIEAPDSREQTQASSVPLSVERPPPADPVPGQKRTATGNVKTPLNGAQSQSDTNPAECHLQNIDSPSRGDKIAVVSAHLRSRLSYAAVKVEKGWQRDNPRSSLWLRSSAPVDFTAGPVSQMSRPMHETSENTIASAPDTSECSHIYQSNSSFQMASTTQLDMLLPDHISHQCLVPNSHTGPFKTSRLAPPVDIVPGGSSPRRQSNPYGPGIPRRAPYPGHRRYHSQQEFGTPRLSRSSNMTLGPGTPPLRSIVCTEPPATHGHSRARTQSPSTLMEQDAIETLLFMSSPGNPGYRPSSRPMQDTVHNLISSETSHLSSTESLNCQLRMSGEAGSSSLNFASRSIGVGYCVGDEVDRLLDQMEDSNSEDEQTMSSTV